ncbi:MAG TPA: GAF and ANTAR domain-containing protein [Jatrophihabitantaceae bacterium]|jgi:GAF domain-containing protein|nr:GAF and ANTAR domain-containing protein [Jatrophihabitantaceae bacterium]
MNADTGSVEEGRNSGERSAEPVASPSTPEIQAEAVAEEEDLRVSLTGLSQLATGQMELSEVLIRVAEFAVRAVPGADGAGLTLMEGAGAQTIVASAPFVEQVDAVQYGIGEGPCIAAAETGRTMRSASLGSDGQWPRFGARVQQEFGVHSALSLPLLAGDRILGAMNIYAHERDAFDDRSVSIGELFAVPAAIAVQNAQVLAQTRRLAGELQSALINRAVIDQAIGIIRSRTGCSQAEAFDRLRNISQGANQKLRAVAQNLVDEAVHRAQTRHRE